MIANAAREVRMNAPLESKVVAEVLTLSDDERQPCEVWTRVMGYHRPVASFNIGKKGEHAERRFFREERARLHHEHEGPLPSANCPEVR
jgi:hypothetical protein